jgi:dipeptide/tripeptide permease
MSVFELLKCLLFLPNSHFVMFIVFISVVMYYVFYAQVITKLYIQFVTRSMDDLFLLSYIKKITPDDITHAFNALHIKFYI